MAKAIINRFDGGLAEDLRTLARNQCATSVNFDIHTNPHKLTPFSDPVAETSSGPMTDDSITDVVSMDVSGTVNIFGMGRDGSGNQDVAIFKKGSTTDITSAWSQVATNSNDLTPGTLIEYKNLLFFIAGGSTWSKFTAPSTIAGLTTFAGGYTSNFAPKPFRHPIDDTVYFGIGNRVYKFDQDVTYTTATLLHTMGTNQEIQSFTEYGNYLAFATTYLTKNKRSSVYLSNRMIPNDGTQAVIDWGDGALPVIENIGGSIVGISYTVPVGNFSTVTSYKLYVKVYSGGTLQTIKEIETGRTDAIRVWKAKSNDKLYFGFDTDNSVYVVGKNKAGEWFVAKDRFTNPTGSFITGTFNGVSMIGDIAFTAYQDGGTTGYLARQGTGTAYTLSSQYKTTINPNMDTEDRLKKKKLKEIRLSYTVSTANATVNVYLFKDGGVSQLALTKTQTSTGEYMTKSEGFDDGTAFDSAYEFQFLITTTGNASIKELDYIYDPVNDN